MVESCWSPGRGVAGGNWGSGGLGLFPWGIVHSWGPDDDGKTVDGPHQLGKVTVTRADALFTPFLEE